MIRAACLLLCLALAGCASAPRVEVQRVEVPIAVPCVPVAKVPIRPDDRFGKTAASTPMDEQVRALLVDREASRLYGDRLRALVDACVIP